jgi:hypothetical protein
MKKLIHLNGAEALTSKQQKKITAGLGFPSGDKICCGCVVQNKQGFSEILKVSCDLNCPGGGKSVSGLEC